MQITPPFGYREIVPLQQQMAVRLPTPGELPPFAAQTNAVPMSYTEFAPASRDYPIVFTSGDGKTFTAVAVTGTAPGENLFVRDGRWDAQAYVPAYVRRHPFCMARMQMDNVGQPQRLVCLEKSAVVESGGERLFDDAGKPSERWGPLERFINEYEADLERTREMCALLAEYKLLEPFALQAKLPAGELSLNGMARVDERRLAALDEQQLRDLLGKGILGRIYVHLVSLENFPRLLARKAGVQTAQPASERQAAPAPAPVD
jgi:hypothetical protein